ncbi:uncharacterized protein EI90DRAFT_2915615, partial [Cantharellus anzutake]|uniref:uncharacterized protein n=1 Tax=Cantharellus anzutake TaxID=1750568 RepID=UPI001904CC2D
ILSQLRYPAVAHHDSTEACLPGTRIDLLNRIMAWCRNTENSEKRVMLLTAVAGAGKTSIAHSVAEECTREGILLSTFFFRACEQSQPDHLFSGMARSLAARDHAYGTFITSILREDPTLTTAPFTMQFKKLVAELLLMRPPSSDRPMVVVIDALDECDKGTFPRLADILRKEVPRLPSNIKFFLTSRQFDLVDRFLSPESPIDRLGINLSDDANVQDCAMYVRTQLRELMDVHPSLRTEVKQEDELVQAILERAGGLFIWASTVFRYMKVASGAPLRMLGKLLDTGANQLKASAEEMVDTLYASILEKCNWKDEDFAHDYPIVMGAILIAQQPLSITAWGAILSPHLESSVEHTLVGLAPLLLGLGDPHTPIHILHLSLRDFLLDRIDSQSPTLARFAVDARKENVRVAVRCVEILNEDLPSMAGLGLVEDLSERVELPPIPQATLSEQFRYGCRHIVYHLNQIPKPVDVLNVAVRRFLNEQITRWVEVCARTEGFQEACDLASDSVALCRCLVMVAAETYCPDLAESLGNLGVSLSILERRSELLPVMEESVKLWRQLISIDPELYAPKLAHSLNELHSLLHQLRLPCKALPTIQEGAKIWRQLVAVHPPSHTPGLARSLRKLAWSLMLNGRGSEALSEMEEGVRLCRQLVSVDPTSHTPILARTLWGLVLLLVHLGRHSEAIPVGEESVKLSRQLVSIHPTSCAWYLGCALMHYGHVFYYLGRYPEALLVHEESVELWRQLATVHPTSYTLFVAGSLENINETLSNLGRHSDTLSVIEESVDLWRQLVAMHPASHNLDLARSLVDLNMSLSNLGRHSAALGVIEESVKLYRQLVAVQPGPFTEGLAQSLHNLSVSLNNLGRYAEALPVIEESVKLWRQLVAPYPMPHTPNLAASLESLNESLDKLGRRSEALSVIEECVKLSRQLFAIHPTSYNPNLARSLKNLSKSLNHLGRHSEALPVIEESVQLWRQSVAILPASHTPGLARSLQSLSSSLHNLDNHAEALPFIEESVALWRSLSVAHPTSYASDLALALQTLSTQFSCLGHYADALDMGNESLLYYLQLHSEYPLAYAPQLQLSYSCVADALEGLGRHDELATVRTLIQDLRRHESRLFGGLKSKPNEEANKLAAMEAISKHEPTP